MILVLHMCLSNLGPTNKKIMNSLNNQLIYLHHRFSSSANMPKIQKARESSKPSIIFSLPTHQGLKMTKMSSG